MTTLPSLLDPTILETSESYVPYVRRRNTPAQLCALQQLFETNPHPTRSQRQVLANEIGMELKSVTNWFQNRRQTSRKKSLSNENNPPRTFLPSSPVCHRHGRLKTPLDRSKISLDRIATLSERPSLTFQSNSQRPPLTPRKSNVQRKRPSSPSELWTYMLSSPAVPPFSPGPEEVRLAALSSRAKTLCPLVWACHKARQKKWVDEDTDGSFMRPLLGGCPEVDEEREVINSADTAPSPENEASHLSGKDVLFSRPNMTPQLEDVEAAITLLGFKTRT